MDHSPAHPSPQALSYPPVRSYNARRGRLSERKRRALADLGPRFAPLDHAEPVPAWWLAGREAPTLVEIGAGTGEAALAFATAHPEWNVVACEVHHAAVAMFLLALDGHSLPNVRVAQVDAIELLSRRVLADSVDRLRVFFPDPWPKARQAHRRLVQAPFGVLASTLLSDGGTIELATDDASYAAQIREVLDRVPELEPLPVLRADRPVTHYEGLALAAGRPVADLGYRRSRRLADC